MLAHISSIHFRTSIINSYIIKVCSFISFPNYTLFSSSSFSISSSSSTCSRKLSITHFKSPYFNHTHVGKTVFLKHFSLLNYRVDRFSLSNVSVNELLLRVSHVCPETARKCLSVCEWKPENVRDLLLGFELGCRKSGFDAGNVECLWGIFRRVGDFNEGLKHLPESFEVMASMLINVGMFREAELLLYEAEMRGILLASDGIFSRLIEGFVNACELERALFMYEQVKGRRLVLSLSCFRSIINALIKEGKIDNVIRVYEDMVEAGFEFGDVETSNLEILISFLCLDGKMMLARNLLRSAVSSGWKPSRMILSEVANVYFEKRDFSDLLNFFSEMKCSPDVLVGNKVIHFLCSHFGINKADSFLWELEQLGFYPNEITFGIFICFCCRDGKLRDAFYYLSEIFSKGLKPDRHSYNALISSLFKVDMKEHARDILNDMVDNGIKPDLATFRALLAGYCDARQFDQVKLLINEMTNSGLIVLSPLDNPISKAFCVLGLDPLTVKVKRDNDLRNFRAEFFDELGNGLYLDTNLVEFEKTVTRVLDESLIPDFNLIVSRLCDNQNVKEVLLKLDEMALWGQELLPAVLSRLVRLLVDSNYHFKAMPEQLNNFSQLFTHLDHESLNLLLQALCKSGFGKTCMLLLHEMHRRNLPITTTTANMHLLGNEQVKNALELSTETELKGWNICSAVHCEILEGLLSEGRISEVEKYMAVTLEKPLIFEENLHNSLIRKFIGYGRLETAVKLLDQILKAGNVPESSSYACIVQGFCDYDNLSRAMEFLTEMLHRNLQPSLETWDLVIDKFCRQGHTAEAEGVLNSMVKVGQTPTKKMYSAVINRYRLENNLSKSSELLHRMQQHGYEPDFTVQWSLISSLSKSDNRQCDNQGFLSRLLGVSGFLAGGRTKSKLR